MGVTAVFIDGGYLDKVMWHDHPNRRIDYAGLVRAMVGDDDLLRAYYYHCLPYQSDPPTEEERERYAAKHRFVTALRHIPRFEVRLGKLAYRGTDGAGQPIFQQKRVDLMLGVDIACLTKRFRSRVREGLKRPRREDGEDRFSSTVAFLPLPFQREVPPLRTSR